MVDCMDRQEVKKLLQLVGCMELRVCFVGIAGSCFCMHA